MCKCFVRWEKIIGTSKHIWYGINPMQIKRFQPDYVLTPSCLSTTKNENTIPYYHLAFQQLLTRARIMSQLIFQRRTRKQKVELAKASFQNSYDKNIYMFKHYLNKSNTIQCITGRPLLLLFFLSFSTPSLIHLDLKCLYSCHDAT